MRPPLALPLAGHFSKQNHFKITLQYFIKITEQIMIYMLLGNELAVVEPI